MRKNISVIKKSVNLFFEIYEFFLVIFFAPGKNLRRMRRPKLQAQPAMTAREGRAAGSVCKTCADGQLELLCMLPSEKK